ncbi:MAG: hypothetical protein R3344_15350, partial [Acidobacteriota bacterium]|nr:hypothetical protein [Acidobacteriota bacterium]
CQPGGIALDPLVEVAHDQDFMAVLFGDCTGNWKASQTAFARRDRNRDARLVAGRAARKRGGMLAVPIYVRSSSPFHAVELLVTHDPSVRLVAVRSSRRARGALVRHTDDGEGRLTVAMASAEPIRRGRLLVIELSSSGRRGTGDGVVRILAGSVDEEPAQVEHRRFQY